MAHYYFTPSFLISTTTLKFIFALSTSSIYFSLLYFIPLERTPSSYNQRPAELNYTIMLFWLSWGKERGAGGGWTKLLSILNLILNICFLHTEGEPFLSNSLLLNRHTIACRTRNEPFPLLVHSAFPTFFITKPDPHLLIIFLTLLLFSFQLKPHLLHLKNMKHCSSPLQQYLTNKNHFATSFAQKCYVFINICANYSVMLIYTRIFFEHFVLKNAILSNRSKSCFNVSERKFCSTENCGGFKERGPLLVCS